MRVGNDVSIKNNKIYNFKIVCKLIIIIFKVIYCFGKLSTFKDKSFLSLLEQYRLLYV